MPKLNFRTKYTVEHTLRWDLKIENGQTIDLFSRAPTEPGATPSWPHLTKQISVGRMTIGPEEGYWMITDVLPDWDDALIRVWLGEMPYDFDGVFLRREHEILRINPTAKSMLGRPIIVPTRQRVAVEVMHAERERARAGPGAIQAVVKMRWFHVFETDSVAGGHPGASDLGPR